jgi:translocation and assembly module TamB
MRLPRARFWFGLLAAQLILAAVLVWLVASEPALRFLLHQAENLSGGKLAITGVHGALIGPLRIEQLRLDGEKKRFELRELRLDWSPRELWQRHLRIDQLELRELRVIEIKPSAEPMRPPESLRLPFSLGLPRARLDLLVIKTASREWRFDEIELGLDKPADTYRLDLRALTTPWGRALGQARLAESAPFRLTGEARFRHASGELTARAGGQLDRFELTADAALAGGRGQAELRLTPFASRLLESARISAEQIDPARWDKTLPEADLNLLAELRGQEGGNLGDKFGGKFGGNLTLRNALPGTWDKNRLPFREVTAQMDGNTEAMTLQTLRLDLDRAGKFSGDGHIDAAGVRLDLHTDRFDPRGLHGKLHALPLAGDIQLRGDRERQRLVADLGYQRYRLRLEAEHHERVLRFEQARLSSGAGSLSLYGELSLEVGHPFDLAGALEGFDPAAYGDYPAARVNASFNLAGRLAPAPAARLSFAIADSHFRRLPLSGQGNLRLDENRLWDSVATLRLGANQLDLRGAFGAAGDRVSLQLKARQLDVIHGTLSGQIEASGTLAGTLAAPAGQLEIGARDLGWGKDYRLGELHAKARVDQGLDGNLSLDAKLERLRTPQLALAEARIAATGTRDRHTLRLAASNPDFDLDADLAGGLSEAAGKPDWSGRVERLVNRGRVPFTLLAPARLTLSPDRQHLEAADFTLLGARLALREASHQAGALRGDGAFSGLSATALAPWVKWPETVGGDLVLAGKLRFDADETLNGELELTRERGDLILGACRTLGSDSENRPRRGQFSTISPGNSRTIAQEMGEKWTGAVGLQPENPKSDRLLAKTALGLKQLHLKATARDKQLRVDLEADGSILGQLRAGGETRLSRRDGVWGLAGDAPLQASADLALRSLAWAAPLLDKHGVSAFDGHLVARLEAGGTLAAPRLSGTLDGERFTLALPDHGLNFDEGRFQALLRQDTLELKQFSLRGGDGKLSGQGSLALRDSRPDLRLELRADKLKVISRPDRLLILSGDGKLALEANKLRLESRLKADRCQFELADDDAPVLSEDVVVLGREGVARPQGLPWAVALDLDLDLNDRCFLRARGLDAQLGGSLKLSGRQAVPLRANGSIRVVKGAYAAYGQRLNIERGILNFQGPLDNPGLNIVAMRSGLTVEAGVSISGTARAPVVRLISRPTLPDSEILSWLVLGHGISEAGGQEFDVMQLAAGALLSAGESVTLQQRIAHAAGLEEVSLKGAGNLESTILTLGKRLSSRAYLSYEQGLSGNEALVKINYTLTKRLSLRAQAGTSPALDLFYTFSFD